MPSWLPGLIVAIVIALIAWRAYVAVTSNPLYSAASAISSLGKTDGIDRGVGKIPNSCPAGKELGGAGSALCYNKCSSLPGAAADLAANKSLVLNGVGPACWSGCPAGFTDFGVGCTKPAPYDRGAGTPLTVTCPPGWKVQGTGTASWCDIWDPFLRTQSADWTCKPGEERNGERCYPKCKPGFHNVGCCICSPDCPAGFVDSGVSCTKKSYTRDVGTPMVCPAGMELQDTLCYQPCMDVSAVKEAAKSTGKTFHGVGPVCWQNK